MPQADIDTLTRGGYIHIVFLKDFGEESPHDVKIYMLKLEKVFELFSFIFPNVYKCNVLDYAMDERLSSYIGYKTVPNIACRMEGMGHTINGILSIDIVIYSMINFLNYFRGRNGMTELTSKVDEIDPKVKEIAEEIENFPYVIEMKETYPEE